MRQQRLYTPLGRSRTHSSCLEHREKSHERSRFTSEGRESVYIRRICCHCSHSSASMFADPHLTSPCLLPAEAAKCLRCWAVNWQCSSVCHLSEDKRASVACLVLVYELILKIVEVKIKEINLYYLNLQLDRKAWGQWKPCSQEHIWD